MAGQVTGTEGYCEAAASGLMAALNTYADIVGAPAAVLPASTALGALLAYATDPETGHYEPMHVNFGLVPPLPAARARQARTLRRVRAAGAARHGVRGSPSADDLFGPEVVRWLT